MTENEKNQKRLEYLIDEAFDDIDIEEKTEEQKIEFSAEHNKKIKKILHREQKRRILKKYNNYLKKGVAILLLAFIGVGVLTFSVEAYRIKFLNFIIEYTNRYTEIKYNVDNDSGNNINYTDKEGLNKSDIQLKYIPNGFSLKRGEESDNSIYMFFENEDKYFILSGNIDEGAVHIDTENAKVRKIYINNKECMLVEKNNTVRAFWVNNEMFFSLAGNIEENEIIEIIKNFE
ncbi:MAG: DUF4367 domain-containing protein [Clostridia bacterium]|nr:DUF4367 domain-containing protein [Clostridia bacterium]